MERNEQKYISPEEVDKQNAILDEINQNFTAEFIDKKCRHPLYKLITYGCQMNERDSETISGMLSRAGFESCEEQKDADLILFNTCCIRDHAEMRVFGNIGSLAKIKKEKPELLIGVCGCMMQQEEVAKHLFKTYKFVDMVFGTHSLYLFPRTLANAISGQRVYRVIESDGQIAENQPVLREKTASAAVNIMYGCNNYCTYCIVPYVRGRERSRGAEDILTEIKSLAAQGAVEVTLLGQNVNSYGNDFSDGTDRMSFAQLLRAAEKIKNIKRIRFMTSHPKDISDELIETIANSQKICNHVHLPVQSGSNAILKKMNRHYTREHYLHNVQKMREQIQGLQLTSDIIVGFPGETEEDFEQTLDLIKTVGFSTLFTFMFSARKGTAAYHMPDQLPQHVKKQRLQRLNELQDQICIERNKDFIGKQFEVFVEGVNEKNPELLIGKTTNFKAVSFLGDPKMLGSFVYIKITESKKTSLMGEFASN